MALLDPVPGANITQPWGVAVAAVADREPAMWTLGDRAYWLKFPGSTFHDHFHPGIDRALGLGKPILAAESGKVLFAGWKNNISGNVIHVEIRPGTIYGFGHCSEVLASAGDIVARGQTIARIGKSGSATGPHTHSFVSITEKGNDGKERAMLFNPALFEAGGALADDERVAPLLAATGKLVTLKGPGVNIRTSPDLDVGASNLYATSRPNGIFRNGKLIHPNVFTGFPFLRELTNDDGPWVEVIGFHRILYIHRDLVTIG